ncbi:hypothetical protein ma243 [Moumouvirus australiensis]|uniref:Uncharacterized protein n=1 Tax=Moumouvirus australiensis TaxID=2109587 RepID=A0A2P1EL61_9VIRU|nr:hypothetical protein QKC55_gp661 [Moumouvirus australiensis]AVL94629.1 hypothetical protein ma243 [Moumouvirus australiensis]
MYNYYKIDYNTNNFDKNQTEKYSDLFFLFKDIYSELCSKKSKDLVEKMKITKYYMNHAILYFKLKYETGLIMYNENNIIRICDFFPEFTPMDKIIESLYFGSVCTKNNYSQKPISIKTKKISQEKKPRNHKFLDKGKKEFLVLDTFNKNSTVNKENSVIEDNKDLILFKSDKNSYKLIKNDIDKGILDSKDINMFFADKFTVFKLLETRNCLDLENNDNIKTEYELFKELYEPEENIISEEENIYVPYNYHYISEQEKKNHAKKYGMSVEEFENKYVNNSVNPVNNITFKVERCDSEDESKSVNDVKTDLDISSDSNENNTPNKQVDPEFLQLIKNLY